MFHRFLGVMGSLTDGREEIAFQVQSDDRALVRLSVADELDIAASG